MWTRRVADSVGKVWFIVDGVATGSPEERSAQHLAFTEVEGGWGRGFDPSSSFLEEAYEGFSRLAPLMLVEAAAPRPGAWKAALEAALGRARSVGVDPFVVGSAALGIHGVAVVPGDIDFVLTEEDGAHALGEALVDVLVEPVARTSNWVCRAFGRSFLEHYCVEWAAGVESWVDRPDPVDYGPEALERSVVIHWRGHSVRVPPLDLLRSVNMRRDRNNRVAAIDAL